MAAARPIAGPGKYAVVTLATICGRCGLLMSYVVITTFPVKALSPQHGCLHPPESPIVIAVLPWISGEKTWRVPGTFTWLTIDIADGLLVLTTHSCPTPVCVAPPWEVVAATYPNWLL